MTPGERIGPYEIEAPIGEGGMGEVFRARDTRLHRTVAIKLSKTAFTDRFEREARAIAALNHPHICTLYDVGPNYLVMEYIEGAPLKGPLPVAKAIEYASQILDALAAAHQKGLTHRDLKPANILVTKQGIKLLDFGLAKQTAPLKDTDATLTQALTSQGQILGTLQYMSPEQLQGREADARSDLFAFGCVLYEILSGKRAFEGASAASVIAAILEREPTPLDLHPPLGRVIAKCLAKDPDERFQNARDLKYNLTLAMEPRSPVPLRSNRILPAALAVALALGATGGWFVARDRKTPTPDQPVRFQLMPPEGTQFEPGHMALAPDGHTLAFVARVKGQTGLWIRHLAQTGGRAIPGTEGASAPFWSPDGKSVAYLAGGKLWRVDPSGGAPFAICEATLYGSGAWSPDGTIILAGGTSRGLLRVPANGGVPEQLTRLDSTRGETGHNWPQLIEGGRLLYWIRSVKTEYTGVYAASLAKPGERKLVVASSRRGWYAEGQLFWSSGSTLMAQPLDLDRMQLVGAPHQVANPIGGGTVIGQLNLALVSGELLLYAASTSAVQLTWFDRSGKQLGTVGEPGGIGTPSFSPDGNRLVVSRENDLWLVELQRNVWSRFTLDQRSHALPVWSPDGRWIAYRSGATYRLVRKESSGNGPEEAMTGLGSPQNPSDWSRDGRWIVHTEPGGETQLDLSVLRVPSPGASSGPAQSRIYLRTKANERLGQFFPGSTPHWIIYQSDESGRDEIYGQTFPEPRGKVQISTKGGSYPAWSPDGREIFYLSPESKMMAVSVRVTPDSLTPAPPRELFEARWARTALDTPYTVAPDGQRFLVRASASNAVQPLQVILNWPALLKKGVE